MARIKAGRAQVCVATDVAARGIDLPDLELVVHADLPKNTEALLHRSGRTGRAGRKGTSVLIVPYSARRRTERLLREANIQAKWGEPPSADDIKQRDDQRLLGDALLQAPPGASEEAIVDALLTQHDPAHIAAAFVRLYRKGQAAPEDIGPAPETPRAPDNFTGGAWVALSTGRANQAEPRWLIPMLCRNGGLTKRDIGQIKLMPDHTLVQLDAAQSSRFFKALGKRTLERGITVTRLDGTPDMSRAAQREHDGARPSEGRHSDARPRDVRPSDSRPNKPAHAKKKHRGNDAPQTAPWGGKTKRDFGPRAEGEADSRPPKPWVKKTFGGKKDFGAKGHSGGKDFAAPAGAPEGFRKSKKKRPGKG